MRKTFLQFRELLIFLNLVFILTSCSTHEKTRHVIPSFYYWKTIFNLSDTEQDFLRQCNVQKLYFRFFDVVWDKHLNIPLPVSALQFQSPIHKSFSYVPTIFITNQAMISIPDTMITDVGNKICTKIKQMISILDNKNVSEIQLDCDWNENTREKYFRLIQLIQHNFKNEN